MFERFCPALGRTADAKSGQSPFEAVIGLRFRRFLAVECRANGFPCCEQFPHMSNFVRILAFANGAEDRTKLDLLWFSGVSVREHCYMCAEQAGIDGGSGCGYATSAFEVRFRARC